jgi:D-2-hydroxyacid dehydrogenase (NADP+)
LCFISHIKIAIIYQLKEFAPSNRKALERPKMLNILVFLGKDPAYFKTVAEAIAQERDLADLRLIPSQSKEHLMKAIAEAEVFLTFNIPHGALASARKLRWLALAQAGVEEALTPEVVALVRERGIAVTNASGVAGPMVAEHALALMLALVRQLKPALEYQQERQWAFDLLHLETDNLFGKTVAILGFGNIGRRVAELCKAFQMRVLALDMAEAQSDLAERVYPPHKLQEVLSQADFVVLCLPLTRLTQGLINRSAFSAMKPGSYLVNVARGGLVDEVALLEALDSGQVTGAALDVVAKEPLPKESPLWEHPKIIISHHLAGSGKRYFERLGKLMAQNIRNFQEGKPLTNLVDIERGF